MLIAATVPGNATLLVDPTLRIAATMRGDSVPFADSLPTTRHSMLGSSMARDTVLPNVMSLLVIANPRSGRGRGAKRVDELVRALHQRGLPFVMRLTTGPGHATSLAADSRGAVAVVGGDGTVHEVLNGLPTRDGRLGPLAVLAAGNGDDFAANAGSPSAAAALVEQLAAGTTRAVDVGEATVSCEHGRVRRRFANHLGIGFDAMVAAAAQGLRPLRGRPLYVTAALRALVHQRGFDCEFTFTGPDGESTERQSILLASICNGARIGGGLPMAPDARLDDGLFDALRVASCGRSSTLLLLLRLLRRRHLQDPRVRLVRCRTVRMRLDQPTPVTMDGEPIARQATVVEVDMATEPLLLSGP